MTRAQGRKPVAFIYSRISEDRSGAGLGVQRQEEDCRKKASELGLTVLDTFTDNDISAFSGKNRPEYQAMLNRLHEVGHVIVWHSDRLHRRLRELEDYLEACERHDILTHSATGGPLDLATPTGRLHARMGAMLASHESEHKAERISRKALETIRQGRSTGGIRPFGYDLLPRTKEEKARKLGARFAVNEREAEALRKAAQDFLDGRPLTAICRDWNNPDRPGGPLLTTHGREWQIQSLKRALVRERNVGIATHKGKVIEREGFPPIMDYPTWLAVRDALGNRKAPTGHSNKAKHLCSGIAVCQCGEPARSGHVHGRAREDGTRPYHLNYVCRVKGAGHVSKRAAHVDDVVKIAVHDWFAHPVRYSMGVAPEDQEQVDRLERERKNIPVMREALEKSQVEMDPAEYDPAYFARMDKKLAERELEIEAELQGLRTQVQREELPSDPFRIRQSSVRFKEFLGWHIDDQRDFLRATFSITLLPHFEGSPREFDPHTVQVNVRDGSDTDLMVQSHPGGPVVPSGENAFYGTGDLIGPHYPNAPVKARIAAYAKDLQVIRRLEAEARGEDPPPVRRTDPRPVPKWRRRTDAAP